MMRYVLAALALCLAAGHQCAWAQDAERNYDGVFDGLLVLPQYVEKIKLFDRMAFADGQERYVAADLRKVTFGARKQEVYQASVFYDGTLASKPVFIRGNLAVLRGSNFYPYLREARSADKADLIIIGSEKLVGEEAKPADVLPQKYAIDLSSYKEEPAFHILDNGQCVIFSARTNYKTQKTVAVVAKGGTQDPPDEMQKAIISCINRAHYLHFGFQNVINIEADSFTERGGVTKLFRMNSDFSPYLPVFFRDGSMAGKTRLEVLRTYAEHAATGR